MADRKNTLVRLFLFCSLAYITFLLLLNCIACVTNGLFIYLLFFAVIFVIVFSAVVFIKPGDFVFIIVLFLTSFSLKAIIAINVHTVPFSDFELFYEAAKSAAQGDFSLFSNDPHFRTWAYQTGIALYYAGLIKVFGSGLLPLMLVNCACIAGVNLFVYLFAKNYSLEKHARIIALLYMSYPATYFLASVLTNQHIFNLFTIAGIYVFISQFRTGELQCSFFRSVTSGVLLALGNMMRPQGILVIAAISTLSILELCRYYKDKAVVGNYVKSAVLTVSTYFLIGLLLSSLISLTGINKRGLANDFPLWKFVTGLNYETKGMYSDNDVRKLIPIKDRAARDRLAKEIIVERISDPIKLLKLFYVKQYYMWAGFDWLNWGFGHLFNKNIEILGSKILFDDLGEKLLKLERGYFIAGFVMLWLGIFSIIWRKEDINKSYFLLLLIIMAHFGIFLLIEIQPRYRDFPSLIVFILGAKGLKLIL